MEVHVLLAQYDDGRLSELFDDFRERMEREFSCTRREIMELFESALEQSITYARTDNSPPPFDTVQEMLTDNLMNRGKDVWQISVMNLRGEAEAA